MKDLLNVVYDRNTTFLSLRENHTQFYEDQNKCNVLLNAQISQDHDKGTRQLSVILKQVEWLQDNLITTRSKILDLGCGPGFYSHVLSKKGHQCVGIDISKSAIDYATRIAKKEQLRCSFHAGNMLTTEFPNDCDVVLLIYSIVNQLDKNEFIQLLDKTNRALKPGGTLYLEVLDLPEPTEDYTSNWYTSAGDQFFCHNKHIGLGENYWDATHRIFKRRTFTVDLIQNKVSEVINCFTLYTHQMYSELLRQTGFDRIQFLPHIRNQNNLSDQTFFPILAHKIVKEHR